MTLFVQVLVNIIQMVIGIMILAGEADIRTIGWLYTISGALVIFTLVVVGLVEANKK